MQNTQHSERLRLAPLADQHAPNNSNPVKNQDRPGFKRFGHLLLGLSIFLLGYAASSSRDNSPMTNPINKPAREVTVVDGARAFRFGTFNIRYDGRARSPIPIPSAPYPTPSSPANGWGELPWSERRYKLAETVLWEELDVVGFQEVLTNQVEDLSALLGKDEWDWQGVGRNNGKKAGEYVPIFYKSSTFNLLSTNHFWLSPTPSKPGSIGWDAGQTRMCTLIHLQDVASGKKIWVANTHWDDGGVKSRAEAAKVILEEIGKIVRTETDGTGEDEKIVLLGDLNSPSSEDGYQNLTGHRYSEPASGTPSSSPSFIDTRHSLTDFSPFGDFNTFTGFQPTDKRAVIDVVMVLDTNAKVNVKKYGVIPNQFETEGGGTGFFVSDHRLVVAEVEWE